jgi:hypothetical protein
MRSVTESLESTFDTGVPHSARLWNYWLGGSDNFASDRAAGDEIARRFPSIIDLAAADRAFLRRAVRYFVAEQGVRQILDIGSGLPTADNTHQVAQSIAPDARIVYVDNDPLVLAHARALLTSNPQGATEYMDADLHDPGTILKMATRTTLDLSQPVGLILMNILGHVGDLAEAGGIVRQLMAALPSGSYLVTADGTNVLDGPAFEEAIGVWNANAPLSYHLRSPEQLSTFLTGLEVVEPGLVPCNRWRPRPGTEPADLREVDEFGAVARKP